MNHERPKCSIEGCKNMTMAANRRKDGTWIYKKLCGKHHRLKYGMRLYSNDRHREVRGYTERPCQKCGWHESYCDVHRIKHGANGGKYVPDNVLVLCPNCHRVEHRGTF